MTLKECNENMDFLEVPTFANNAHAKAQRAQHERKGTMQAFFYTACFVALVLIAGLVEGSL